MGRRAKMDIWLNPTEFDFEVRPRKIIPLGFEDEAIKEIDKVLAHFHILNPRLHFVFQTNEATFFRFEQEVMVAPAQHDIVGRLVCEPIFRKMRIYAVCIPLKSIFNEAELFYCQRGHRHFNHWEEVEVEFKDATDNRFKRLLKYP